MYLFSQQSFQPLEKSCTKHSVTVHSVSSLLVAARKVEVDVQVKRTFCFYSEASS